MIGRRGFLGVLAAAVLDPERLLWVPGRKLVSIPEADISAEWRKGYGPPSLNRFAPISEVDAYLNRMLSMQIETVLAGWKLVRA
jgi:hypothetical protein